MARRAGAAHEALVYLDTRIRQAIADGRPRLPPVASMALAARVSKGTMHRAVKLRTSQQHLRTATGSGIVVLNGSTTAIPDRPARTTSNREPKQDWLRKTIAKDITNGRFPAGSILPHAKQLCATYGVGFRTLKATLTRLIDDNVVTPWARGYRIPSLLTPSHAQTILVVARGTQDYIQLVTERTVESLATLEHECAARGLLVRVAPVYYSGTTLAYGDALARLIVEGPHKQNILGVVLFSAALGSGRCKQLASAVTRTGVPLAIIDEADAAEIASITPGRRLRVFSIAYGSGCGVRMGRLLSQLNHRHAAYISTSPDSDWSRERCDGVRRGIGADIADRSVTSVRLHMADVPAGPEESGSPVFSSARGTLGALHRRRALMRGVLWPEQQIARLILSYRPWQQNSRKLDSLLGDTRITAWVADNDVTALICLSLLESRHVPVPGRISLTGFDDGHFALVNNLTSYNFNCRALMLAALDHLLAPSAGGPRQLEIEGYIVQRQTTAAYNLTRAAETIVPASQSTRRM